MGDGRGRIADRKLIPPAIAFVGKWAELDKSNEPVIPDSIKGTGLAYIVRDTLQILLRDISVDNSVLQELKVFADGNASLVWLPYYDMMYWMESFCVVKPVTDSSGLLLTERNQGKYHINKMLANRALNRSLTNGEIRDIRPYHNLVSAIL